MRISLEMQAKLAWLATGAHLRKVRNDPFDPKQKAIHIAQLSVRTTAPDGSAIPDDQMQAEFIITDGSKDSYGSLMTERTMRNYVEDCNNGIVPFMRDHESGVGSQLGRIIHATYEEAEKQVRATSLMLRDTDDTPDKLKVNEYLRRIENKFYTGVSVGFRDADEICNICNKPIFDIRGEADDCPHVPKRYYDGTECTYNVDNARLREVSLVSTPSNQNAKLYDTREWGEDLRKAKDMGSDSSGQNTSDPKSILERDGLKYREQLIKKAIEEGVRAEDDFDEDKWKKRFDTMDAEQIIDQTTTWTKLGDARWGEGGRKTSDSGNPNQRSGDDAILLPPNVFAIY